MTLDEMREAVRLANGCIPLEASGGVTLETVRAIAETGVRFISTSKLTQSASAVDIGLDIRIETRPEGHTHVQQLLMRLSYDGCRLEKHNPRRIKHRQSL